MIIQLLYAGLVPLLTMALLYFYLRYKYPKGNLSPFLYSFFYGVIMSIFVIFVQWLVANLGYAELKNLRRTAFHAFAVVGFTSQFVIFIVLMAFFYFKEYFKTAADGIVYVVGTALGLAFVTGIYHVMLDVDARYYAPLVYSYPLTIVITAIPIGFFTGLAVSRSNTFVDLMTGLLASSFFLGLYMFCLYTSEYTLWVLSGLGTLGIALLFISKAIKNPTHPGLRRKSQG